MGPCWFGDWLVVGQRKISGGSVMGGGESVVGQRWV